MTKKKHVQGVVFRDHCMYLHVNGRERLLAVFVSQADADLIERQLGKVLERFVPEVKP